MGYKDDKEISELGNWNVAADYSRFKIMKHLYLADDYATVAKFGTSNLLQELENPLPVESLQIKGLRRLIDTLIMVIDNSMFAIKQEPEQKKLSTQRKFLVRFEKIIPKLAKLIKNQRTGEVHLKINKVPYDWVLDQVLTIKREMNSSLNKNDLIFTDKKQFDPKEMKKRIIEEATTKG